MMQRVVLSAFVLALCLTSQSQGQTPALPKEAQDALKASTTKIAKSYSLLKDGKTEWTYKVTSVQKGKIDSIWAGLSRHEIFCVVIDPMIPTFTDWKIGNFIVYREEGILWSADEGEKDDFLRLSCANFKAPAK